MLFAPRYAPGNSQPNRLLRAFYGVCLSSFAALLLVANIVLYYANYYLVMPSVSPRELYHRAWVMTRDNFYDPSQLTAWEEWQHKFDDQIETEQDAVKYIRIMLDSLEDPHTFLLEPEDVAASTRNAEGQYVGIGITLGEQLEPCLLYTSPSPRD